MKRGKDCRESLLNGVNAVADTVKETAGAKGKLVLIQDYHSLTPRPTKDGVTVVKNIDLVDAYEKLGADLLKEAALKTAEISGDGTTGTTILAQSLVNKLFEREESHVELTKGLQLGLKDVLKQLDKLKRPVTEKEMEQIATISVNGDKKMGAQIANIYKKVGIDATIKVEEGFGEDLSVVYNEGLRIDRGWHSPHFATNFSKGITEFGESVLVLFNGKIKTINDILHSLNFAKSENLPLVILTNEIEDVVLNSLIKINTEGGLQICVCPTPEHGLYRDAILEDLSLVTGAAVYDGNGVDFKAGKIKNFLATRDKAVLTVEDYSKVEERVELLKSQLESETNDIDIERLKSRISNLKSSVVEVYVGGVTDLDRKERKDRVEDAIPALRVAIEEGFVAGGGSTLNFISNKLSSSYIGYNILLEAIKEPMKTILANGGYEMPEEKLKYGYGVDVIDGKTKNLIKKGIIDPVKVIKTALEHSVAVASTAVQTNSLILTRF